MMGKRGFCLFQEAEKIKNDPKFVNADQSTWDKLFNSVSAYFLSFFNPMLMHKHF